MAETYRCTICGLRSRVVVGGADFMSDFIHCPRCGGQSVVRPGWSDTDDGELVQVELDDDGHTTHELHALIEGGGLQDSTLDLFKTPTRNLSKSRTRDMKAAAAPGGLAQNLKSGQLAVDKSRMYGRNQPNEAPSDEALEDRQTGYDVAHERRVGRVLQRKSTDRYDLGDPSVALAMDKALLAQVDGDTGLSGVELFPTNVDGPVLHSVPGNQTKGNLARHPGAASVAPPSLHPEPFPDPEIYGGSLIHPGGGGPAWGTFSSSHPDRAPGVDWRPSRPPTHVDSNGAADRRVPRQENAARGDKAWSVSVIQRALVETGPDPDDEETEVGSTTDKFHVAIVPNLRIDIPEDGAPATASFGRTGAKVVSSPSTAAQFDTVGAKMIDQGIVDRAVDERAAAAERVERRNRRKFRTVVSSVSVGVVLIGAAVGLLWSGSPDVATSDVAITSARTASLDDAGFERASQRAALYQLEPLDRDPPLHVSYEIVALNYPTRVTVRLDVVNQSQENFSMLLIGAAWYLVHAVPEVVSTETSPSATVLLEPTVSLSQPLAPGGRVSALIEFATDYAPPGERTDSFVWVSVTAADEDEVVYRGGVTCVELF